LRQHPEAKENRTVLPVKMPLHHNQGRRADARPSRRCGGDTEGAPNRVIEAAQRAGREHGLAMDQAQPDLHPDNQDRVAGVQGYAGTVRRTCFGPCARSRSAPGLSYEDSLRAQPRREAAADAGIPSDTLSKHLIDIAKESKPWQSAASFGGRRVIHDEHRAGEGARDAADRQKALSCWLETATTAAIEAGRLSQCS